MTLDLLAREFSVCRLAPEDPLPPWATTGSLFSVSRTESELSVVCEASRVPEGPRVEGPWRVLRVQGTLDFALVGILSMLLKPLADAGISVFALSTFDTDYLLVKASACESAVAALVSAGHDVHRTTV